MRVIRLVMVGDSTVGKTSLLVRFAENDFQDHRERTSRYDTVTRTIDLDNEKITLDMWDTVGKEEFRAMNSFYYNGANGAIVTFDVGNRKSFESLDYWINDIREFAPESAKIVLSANKNDRPESEWKVNKQEIERFAEKNDIMIIYTSAKTGHNVQDLFRYIPELIVRSVPDVPKSDPSIIRPSFVVKPKKQDKCC